jgi:hypothetical protein
MPSQIFANAPRPPLGSSRSPVHRAGRLARTGRKVLDRKSLMYPLNWWRTRAAGDFKKVDVAIARHFLGRTGIIGEPHWYLAASGDAAVAVGVALRVQKRGMSPLLMDVAMTAVLCSAIEGDITAALLISAIVQRFEGNGSCGKAISDSWLRHQSKRGPSTRGSPRLHPPGQPSSS